MANGTLAVWSDIDREFEEDYNGWYEREHMFERLDVQGILRARHYRTLSGTPKFFTYFELEETSVIASRAYLRQTNNSSLWTQRILPHFRDVNRTVSWVVRRLGRGFGGVAVTVRFRLSGANDAALEANLAQSFIPSTIERPGIIAAQLWRMDRNASLMPGQDRDLRPGDDETADLTLFVEGTEIAALKALVADVEFSTMLAAAQSLVPPRIAIHQLLNGAESDEAPPI
ncbi:MAG: hypothetical protein ACI9W2_002895 [Gammaproteobacteria bacterium]|jgi:hypothetical protein